MENRKADQEIKINKNISYFEARRLIVPQLTQTYAQAARLSTISTATQTDPNLSNIICPPLQCLTPISSKNPLPGTSSSVLPSPRHLHHTQGNLLPFPIWYTTHNTKLALAPINPTLTHSLTRPLLLLLKPNTSIFTPPVSTSSSSTQAQLLPSASSIAATVSQPQPSTPVSYAVFPATNNMFTPVEPSSSIISASSSTSDVQIPKNVQHNSKK
ncbi:hypothetical protein TNCV_1149211 [Trichonephila clavipes]|nr:hypothetical protein TNCV_1149211 [Trichonephila clavipes]